MFVIPLILLGSGLIFVSSGCYCVSQSGYCNDTVYWDPYSDSDYEEILNY